MGNGSVPLLVFDAWEHAFYLQYKNVKADFFAALWNIINWSDVAARLETAKGRNLIPKMALGCRRVTEGQMLFTYPPGRIEREVSRKDWCAARLTRVIAALAEPLEGPVDVIKDSLRLGHSAS